MKTMALLRTCLLLFAGVAGAQEPPSYACRHTPSPPSLQSSPEQGPWQNTPWSGDFVDIRGGIFPAPRYRTRFKLLWDEQALYVCAELAEPHVWGTLTARNSVIYQDNDFELFLDPDGDGLNYYEFEVNALGTLWELTLDKPYSQGGQAKLGTNLPGLQSAVQVRGTLNDPSDVDRGWTVHLTIPWAGLRRYAGSMAVPPRPQDVWRLDSSRVEWPHQVIDGRYVRQPPHGTPIPWTEHPEDNWVWSPTGVIDIHRPDRWGRVQFEP